MNDAGVAALIENGKKPVVLKLHGVEHLLIPSSSGFDLHSCEAPDVPPPVLELQTLTGLVDFIKANRDGLKLEELALHVVNHAEVRLLGKVFGEFNQRFVHARATILDIFGQGFQFGKFQDHESFIIGLQALFTPDDDAVRVLEVVSSIKNNKVLVSEDDGVSQTITASEGATMDRRAALPNPVILRPYRTFREIQQPRSPFVLRARDGGNGLPAMALFESDGGQWKIEAVQLIQAYLDKELEGMATSPTVIA